MDRRKDERPGNPREQPDPGRSGQIGNRPGTHGRHQHLAFQTDVENPGALGKQPGQTGQQQRRAQPQSRIENLQQRCIIHHATAFRRAGTRFQTFSSICRTI